MRRTGAHRPRRSFAEVAFVWVQVFWSCCGCSYNNVGRYRCGGCGSAPPRALRDAVNALPIEDIPADVSAA
jgi:hypothetical protein